MRAQKLLLLLAFGIIIARSFAYFNVTHLTVNVYLSNSTSAKVVESLQFFISNSSIQSYMQDRAAVNQTLSIWQKVLNTNLLVEHIFNPRSSIKNFTLLPGPAIMQGNGAVATISMYYVAENVTSVKEIAPRKFEYTFNDSCFNFQHTASGEALFQNATLNFFLPTGAKALMPIYPLPDYPVDNYANSTQFSWFEAEPLNKFQFSYVVEESLQQEVTRFFSNVYYRHRPAVIAFLIIVVAGIALAVYRIMHGR